MNRDSVRIGTSGWSYREWENVFYPNSKTPKLSYYSNVFNTAEIDSTFYANPTTGLVLGWVRNTPKDFEFSMKVPQSVTHKKQLDLEAGAEIDLIEFLDLVEPVRSARKLGPLLIQLPPSFGVGKLGKLEEFLEALPKQKDYYRFAIEFRNKSWLKDPDSLNELLKKYNVARTIVDEPLLPVDPTPTADFAFIRWHGRGARPWYNYEYKQTELEPWVERVREQASKTGKVYGYFNNHFHGYAIENSLAFLQRLGLASGEQGEALSRVQERIHASRRTDDRKEESGYIDTSERSGRRKGRDAGKLPSTGEGQTKLPEF